MAIEKSKKGDEQEQLKKARSRKSQAKPKTEPTPAQTQNVAPESGDQSQGVGPVQNPNGTRSEADAIMDSINRFAQKNSAAATRLGQKLADAEEAFPRTMMQAYGARKQQYRDAGADTQTFLSALQGKIDDIAAFECSATVISGTAELSALPERAAAGDDGQ